MKKFFFKSTASAAALVLAGIYLAAEAGILLFSAAGKERDPGLYLALYAAELFCGFAVAAVNRRSNTPTAVAGALLLTLRAGLGTHPAAAVCSCLFAGGTAAHLTRSRKKNTLLPFALAFAAGLAGTAFFPSYASYAVIILGVPLTFFLITSAVKLGRLRWLFLLLLPLQMLLFATEEKETELIRRYTQLHLTAASALPAALLPEPEAGKISLLQVTAFPQSAALVPWRFIPFAEEPVLLDLTSCTPAEKQLKKLPSFDLVSLELLPAWHPRALRQLFEHLWKKTDPENGVLVIPRSMCAFIPPHLEARPVPGSENSRWAVGRKKLETDPERLDNRLQERLREAGDQEFMPPGVLPGLYKKSAPALPEVKRISDVPSSRRGIFSWLGAAFLWLFLRLVFARGGRSSAFFAAVDNYGSATLVILTAFTLTAFSRTASHLSEWSYLWCLIPAVPFFGKKGNTERFFLLCSLILPWLLISRSAGEYHFILVFAVAMLTALSAGLTGAKLLLEQGASFNTLCAAGFCGVTAGGLLFSFFFSAENIIPVLAAAALMRLSCLLRK